MAEQRNSELHSGDNAFEKWPNQIWLAQYYRVCSIHLSIQGRALADLFERDETRAAEQMIESLEDKWRAEANKAVGMAKAKFASFSEEKRAELRSVQSVDFHKWSEFVICPACGISAMRWGDPVHMGETRLVNDKIIWDVSVLPTNFKCYSCGLELKGHGLLHAAGVGGQFSLTEEEDPLAYYAPNEAPEPDYDDWGR